MFELSLTPWLGPAPPFKLQRTVMPLKFLFAAIFLTSLLSAQSADFRFYTTADGLSGNLTHDIAQDDRGVIWVLNDLQLHRFDGRSLIPYPSPTDSAGGRYVLESLNSYQDSLLLITSPRHLHLFSPETGHWQSFPAPAVAEGSEARILCTDLLSNGDYGVSIISVDLSEISVYPFDGQRFKAPLHQREPFFERSTKLLPDGRLLFYADEIKVVAPGESPGAPVTVRTPLKKSSFLHLSPISDQKVLTLEIDPSYQKIFSWDLSNNTFTSHPINRHLAETELDFGAISRTPDGNLWLFGRDRTLAYYDAAKDTLLDYRSPLLTVLPNVNDFSAHFNDNTGTDWFMTQLGLLKVTLPENAFRNYFESPLDICNGYCSFRGITEDTEGNVYAAYYHGIARFSPEKRQPPYFFPYDEYAVPLPSDIYVDQYGIWLNNGKLLDLETGDVVTIPGAKETFGEDGYLAKQPDGLLWWTIHNELNYLDTTSSPLRWKKVIDLPQVGYSLTTCLQIGQYSGAIYVGHNGRLLRFDPVTKEQQWYTFTNQEYDVSQIHAVEETTPDQLWLATDVGLINLQLSGEKARRFTSQDGLPNDYVCGMLSAGDSTLWLSTNNGLSRFYIPSESFTNFFEQDGLTHNEFNRKSFFKARDGRMYFGGLRGINAFYPEALMSTQVQRNAAAKIVLSTFEYVDERQDTTVQLLDFDLEPTIDLYYWFRSFTFTYNLTDYRNPEEISYSYRMEGYEDSWSPPSRFNFTRFSSLPTGEYIFQVRARDSNGQWHPDQLKVKVVVHGPWWSSWYAYLLYAITLAAIIYYFWRSSMRTQALRNKLMLEKVEADKLKELDSIKTRLYTSLTHEFRTPLTVILGMANRIKEAPQKHLKEGIRLIESNGKSLLHLINQLLDLSKLETGGLQLDLQQDDTMPYLRYLVESFQTYANSQNLSLRFHTTSESLVMDYDPERLKQVVANLLSNAIKFTPAGGSITVRANVREKQLLLQVSDTGIGIPENKLPYVFDRFYQVNDSVTKKGEGTGIGLAHAQELVKLMGGSIQVESTYREGTTFTVALPIRREATTAAPGSIFAEQQAPAETVSPLIPAPGYEENGQQTIKKSLTGQDERPLVLIIEDNPDVVTYLKSCLDERYRLEVGLNGAIGIEKAIEYIPDLIISDVMMPEKNGYEVCDTLKQDERTSHIPIVMLTAKADAASKIAGLRRGADAYLAKPFDREELLVRLDQLVERQRRMVAYFSAKLPVAKVKKADVQVEDAFIKKLNHHLEENYQDEDFGLPQLCQKIRMSRSQLYRKLKALVGISPSDFIRVFRLNKAKTLLESAEFNVSEVAWKVGYKDLAHFSKSYQDAFGVPPSATNK